MTKKEGIRISNALKALVCLAPETGNSDFRAWFYHTIQGLYVSGIKRK